MFQCYDTQRRRWAEFIRNPGGGKTPPRDYFPEETADRAAAVAARSAEFAAHAAAFAAAVRRKDWRAAARLDEGANAAAQAATWGGRKALSEYAAWWAAEAAECAAEDAEYAAATAAFATAANAAVAAWEAAW